MDTELKKPKYKKLLEACKSKDLFLEHDTINENNRDEIIGSFSLLNFEREHRDGLCFCGKILKRVYNIECGDKVFLDCGKDCLNDLFGEDGLKNKKLARKMNDRFLSKIEKYFLEGNNLGFGTIENWDIYIIDVIKRLVKSQSSRKLEILKEKYSNNNDVMEIINKELLLRQEEENRRREEREQIELQEKKRLEDEKEIEKQRLIDEKKAKDAYEEEVRKYRLRQKAREDAQKAREEEILNNIEQAKKDLVDLNDYILEDSKYWDELIRTSGS